MCVPLARHFESSNPAGLRNSFDRFDHDVSAFSLAIRQGFVLSLYKCDTTRVVGRLVNSTAIHSSLLSITKILEHYQACVINYSPSNLLWYFNTTHLSLNPPRIPTLPASHQYPPHIPTQPTSHQYPHIYLHSLHPIYPPHIPIQPTSHLFPHIYLHSLHLINNPTYTYTACISFIPPHIPSLPASHLSLHIYLHSLHLIHRPTYTYVHRLHLIYPPTYTYTACISFILPTYTYTVCISFIPPIQQLNHHHDSKWSSL